MRIVGLHCQRAGIFLCATRYAISIPNPAAEGVRLGNARSKRGTFS